MKHITQLSVIFTLLTLLLSTVAWAQPSRLDEIAERGYILVGTTGDYKPFSYFNEETKMFEGHDIDAARLLGDALGVEVRFVKTTWKTLTQGILDNSYDVAMSGITRNLTRLKQVGLTSPYIKVGKCPLIRMTDKDRFQSVKEIDVSGVKIGVNPGGTNEKFVLANIKNAEIVVIEKNLSIPEAVEKGEVDVMITDNVEAMLVAGKNRQLYAVAPDKTLTKDDFGYMLPRDDFAFLNWMNLWMHQMHEKGEFAALKMKWIAE
ncbi:transporter substrate-binding domain-containing protein [Desulforhopalus sp. IMCC35007]|uniref:transporter substrate-binding domain-containing protein n=1 Tax=Desulforhopalus sp. IMCC35007 TaxID=2569543 RepID=UPI0010AE19E5|nr:transporter substrate-binding domain-containing protein [Desulforhopalus sp. IMCC35007]TKB08599.1 transporter substrate-binding domain-containing protein [Desulforhopalus sp. IMCC35007]